ncbi:ABC transporter six-transmembrane domain-containing protein [Hoeflea sp.]|uniref:ABC transporter six-transmembrane domain-containing protein n=1 Tax=Hoeflea sp. TaxID=1940281 RepID=UPI003B01DFAE
MLQDAPLTVGTLIRRFLGRISLTWLLTLCETTLTALIPLFMGFAIDGLLDGEVNALIRLAAVLAGLIAVSVARRVYDTRAYGTIRVALGTELIGRSGKAPVSRQNARLGMGRELVDFLETDVPAVMNSLVQLAVSLVILFTFHPYLSYAALVSAVLMIAIYWSFHRRFFRLNGAHNHQTEQQVRILEARRPADLLSHLNILRRIEIRLSDTEAFVYGAIFLTLLGFIVFNLWFAATNLATSVGTIFSIISYSWEFVEAALVLPMTLQGWSRLSEIMQRINRPQAAA